MISVGVFIFWEDYGFAQVMIMVIMSFMNLWILIGKRPFKSDYTNKVEIANEFIVYLCCIFNMCFVNVAVSVGLRSNIAVLMILICLLNVG